MITPVRSALNADVEPAAKPAPRPEPQAPTVKSGALSHDEVTLKSAGDHDSGKG